MKKRHHFLLFACFFCWPFGLHSQTTLLNDTFSDNERSTQSLTGSAAWYTGYTTGSLTASSGELLQTVNPTSGNITLAHFTSSGSPQALGIGDSITLSFKTTFVGLSATTTTPAFRLGLFNSGGTRISADNKGNLPATHEYQNDTGYSLFLSNPAGNNSGYVGARTNLTTDNFYSTGNFTNLTGSSTLSALTDSTAYQITFKITKTSASLMTINAVILDAGTSASMFNFITTDSTYLYDSFDEVAFFLLGNGVSQVATTVKFDDVMVSYSSVPEVNSVFSLLGVLVMLIVVNKKQLVKKAF